MGFDLYGLDPKSEKGEYFRNNVWWWRPLAMYVLDKCCDCMVDSEKEHWGSNDGQKVSEESALKIARRLRELVDSGDTYNFEKQYMKNLKEMPKEDCCVCNGTGIKRKVSKKVEDFKSSTCDSCEGSGKVPDVLTHYPFEVGNVKEFAVFCEQSGGFEIC